MTGGLLAMAVSFELLMVIDITLPNIGSVIVTVHTKHES